MPVQAVECCYRSKGVYGKAVSSEQEQKVASNPRIREINNYKNKYTHTDLHLQSLMLLETDTFLNLAPTKSPVFTLNTNNLLHGELCFVPKGNLCRHNVHRKAFC